jgi:hypothetical protein
MGWEAAAQNGVETGNTGRYAVRSGELGNVWHAKGV